jgi:hypothetical protein
MSMGLLNVFLFTLLFGSLTLIAQGNVLVTKSIFRKFVSVAHIDGHINM